MGWTPRRAAIYGVLAGFAAVAAAEVVRPRGGSAQLVDWRHVRAIAQARLRSPTFETTDLAAAQSDYRLLAARLERPLLEFVGGLPRGTELPLFEALDRRGWLELNLTIIRHSIDPVVDSGRLPNSLLVRVGREGIDRYAGYLLGFLGRRVLGQFDPRLLSHDSVVEAGLYLVEPNVEEWRLSAELPQQDLRRWLILHEMTHAWQFAAHPWLRGYMEQALRVMIDSVAPGRSRLARVAAFAGVLPVQWRVMRQVQAAMSVIEGYSNLVMNQLGAKLLPGFDQLERAHRDRADGQSFLGALTWKLTGLDLKLQQYRRGEEFCRQVFERHGMTGLNRVWNGPDSLPSLDELGAPERWFERISPIAVARQSRSSS